MASVKEHRQPSEQLSQTPRTITLQLFQEDLPEFLTVKAHAMQEPTQNKFDQSPLRQSLETAIAKMASKVKHSSRSRDRSPSRPSTVHTQSTPKSKKYERRRLKSPFSEKSSIQQDREILSGMHPEALDFLKRYFSGCNSRCVAIELFLERLLNDFHNLWNEEQALTILPQLVVKLRNKLGYDYVDLGALDRETKEGGLIGMILKALQELDESQSEDMPQELHAVSMIQRPELQNVLNIIQEFTQGLYKETEKQLYSKLHNLMRKLVLKYRDVESLLTRLNEKITENADIIDHDRTLSRTRKHYEETISELRRKLASMEASATKDAILKESLRAENERLEMETQRLAETIERFQNHLMRQSAPEKANAVIGDKLSKSPMHFKPFHKDHAVECYSMQTTGEHASHKPHELATTRFRSNTCLFPNPYLNNDVRTEYHEPDGQQRTPYRLRRNFDAYELKKGISSILTEKEVPKASDEAHQATPSRCSHLINVPPKPCEHHHCRRS